MNTKELVKMMLKSSKTKAKDVAESLGMRSQTFHNKLHNDTIRFSEVQYIAKLTGYKVQVLRSRSSPDKSKLSEGVLSHGASSYTFFFEKSYTENERVYCIGCQDIIYEEVASQISFNGNTIVIDKQTLDVFQDSVLIARHFLNEPFNLSLFK